MRGEPVPEGYDPLPSLQQEVDIFSGRVVAQMVMRLSTMQQTQVRSLGQEDPLEKEMATHSSILAWEIPCTEKPRGLQTIGSKKVSDTFND